MSAPDDTRRMTDDEFWDQAAIASLHGLASNPDVRVDSHEEVAGLAATYAVHLLAERRKRKEGGGQ